MNNRIIKFRVWNKKTNEWIHGPHKESCLDGVNLFGETILLGAFMPVGLEELNDCIALQFTGMTDRNGREVFEGDIIESDHGLACLFIRSSVEYRHGMFSDSKFGYSLKTLAGETYHGDKLERYAVIGNIFENPELIQS